LLKHSLQNLRDLNILTFTGPKTVLWLL